MSVIQMKLLTISGPLSSFDDVIHDCIINKAFHPEDAINVIHDAEQFYSFDVSNPYTEILHAANQISEDIGIPLEYAPFQGKNLNTRGIANFFADLSSRYSSLKLELEQLTNTVKDNENTISQLENILVLPDKLGDLADLDYVKFRFGRMPREVYDTFMLTSDELDDLFFYPTSVKRDYVYAIYLTPRSSRERVDALFDSLHFEQIQLTQKLHGTPRDSIDELNRDIEKAEKRIAEIRAQLDKLRQDEREAFLTGYSYIRYHNDAFSIRRYGAHTKGKTFVLAGWIPASEVANFESALSKFEGVTWVIDDPSYIKNTKPPVKLKNNLLGRVYQPFVEMYGLPSSNEIDPSFLMAVTYTILFGIMYGDVGQGLVLVLLGLFLHFKKKMWMGPVMVCIGISACCFGFVYGSVFGDEEIIHGFNVLENGENTTRILLVAIIIGVSIIAFSMILNIFNGVKQKDLKKLVFSPNGLAGLVFYVSLVVAFIALAMFGVNLFIPAYVLPLIVLPLILIFCGEPLSKLLSKNPDWKPHSVGSFLMESFFELFELLLSYVTNTVSFLRVGAYAISHAGMMMVVHMLATGADGGKNIVVLVIGNIIVMGIEGLLVCIQVLRLEFYEIFGRFYQSGGKAYNPKIIDYSKKPER